MPPCTANQHLWCQRLGMCGFAILVFTGLILSACSSIVELTPDDMKLYGEFDGSLRDLTPDANLDADAKTGFNKYLLTFELPETEVEGDAGDTVDLEKMRQMELKLLQLDPNYEATELTTGDDLASDGSDGSETPDKELPDIDSLDSGDKSDLQEKYKHIRQLEELEREHNKDLQDKWKTNVETAEKDGTKVPDRPEWKTLEVRDKPYTFQDGGEYEVTAEDIQLIEKLREFKAELQNPETAGEGTTEADTTTADKAEGLPPLTEDDLAKFQDEQNDGVRLKEGDKFVHGRDTGGIGTGIGLTTLGTVGMGVMTAYGLKCGDSTANPKVNNLNGINVLLTLLAFAAFIGLCVGGGQLQTSALYFSIGIASLLLVSTGVVYGVEKVCFDRRRLTPSESALQRMHGSHHRRLAPLESLLDLIEASKQNSMQQESIPWKRV